MSRIGKLPVPIPGGVTVQFQNAVITVKGPKGTLTKNVHPHITVKIEGNFAHLSRASDESFDKSLHGLMRTLLANMIEGVTKGYSKRLEIHGVGYRAQVQGKKLVLSLGFSHPIEVLAPDGIQFEIDKEKKNLITVAGTDKEVVGQVTANIRGLKKPEPYQGKGIRYVGEHIRRKVGKAAAAAAK